MSWIVLALISITTTSIATLFERVLMKEESSNPIAFAILFQFILGLIAWCFALVFGKFVLPADSSMWGRYILSGLLWAGSTVASLKAMKTLPAGEATIIGASSAIFSISLGMLLFGEQLSVPALLGILLIFASIWMVFAENLSFKSRSGVAFGLLSAFFGGTAVINDMVILKTYEAFSYTTLMSLLPGLILLGIFPRHLFRYKKMFNGRIITIMIFLAMFYSIQAITYYLAIEQKAPISKLSPLTKSSIILTVLLAAIFLKERTHLAKKLIAAMAVTAGAVLLG